MDLAMSVLPSPGTPSMQRMAAAEQGGEQLVQDIVLPDHHLRDLVPQLVAGLLEPVDRLDLFLGFAHLLGMHWRGLPSRCVPSEVPCLTGIQNQRSTSE